MKQEQKNKFLDFNVPSAKLDRLRTKQKKKNNKEIKKEMINKICIISFMYEGKY